MGLENKAEQFMYLKLLALTSDLQTSFKILSQAIAECTSNGTDIDKHISSLSETLKDLNKWGQQKLLGDKISSRLRFHTSIVIEHIKLKEEVIIRNNVDNLKGISFNITLYGLVLYNLLHFILIYCKAARLFEIKSVVESSFIKISISGICKNAFRDLIGRNKLDALRTVVYDEQSTLILCYEMLSIYGGNLWSVSSDEENLTVYFSIPVIHVAK